jgi:phenylacetic acid degradation operon negative regulatory protein
MPRRLQRHLDRLLADRPPRATSLIVTLFGDIVLPHGGSIWLGGLIALAAPFAINERLVRTAVLRLSRDGWLESRLIGRRSAYGVTAAGRQRIEDAYRRIYAAGLPDWDGRWCLVLVPLARGDADKLDRKQREALRRELGWLGFGLLGPTVLLHPNPDRASLDHALHRLGLADSAVVIEGAESARVGGAPLRALVESSWDLAEVEAGYGDFLDRFRPAWSLLEAGAARDPETCFRLRSLLIHDYRRAVLRDPLLPAELLSPDWPGSAARALCRNVYRAIEAPAERHVAPLLRNAEGPLPAPGAAYFQRFGGLDLPLDRGAA